MNFTLRLFKGTYSNEYYSTLTLSDIHIIGKDGKFEPARIFKGNQKKFKYVINIKGQFSKVAGSNSYPLLWWKGEYIDIEIKNFPRFPVIAQDWHVARNIMREDRYDGNYLPFHWNNGFEPLRFEILNLDY